MTKEKIAIIIFFITPLTDKLCVGNISISLPLLLLAFLVLVFNPRRRPITINKGLLVVFSLVFIHSLFSYFYWGNKTILNLLIITSFYFVLTFVYPSQLRAEDFYKLYKTIAVIPFVGLIYHLFIIFILGRTVNPLTFFPGLIGVTATDMSRPMSFFSEPSHLASYFLPLFILSLYKRDWKWVLVSLFSIIMSFSMLGLATSAIIGIYYLFTSHEIKYRLIYIALIALSVYYLSSLPIFSYFFERGELIASESDASSMVRVLYGFELIKSLDFKTLLWGIGAGNNIAFFHDDEIFYNSLSGIIIDYGLVLSSVFYFIFFFLFSIKQKPMIIAFQICTLALLASSTLYFTAAFFFQYTFYFVYSENNSYANKRIAK